MQAATTAPLSAIPHPPRLPLLGNLHQLANAQNILASIEKVLAEYGPVVEMQVSQNTIVLVGDHATFAEISQEARFEKAIGRSLELLRPAVGRGLFTVRNEEAEWGKAHRVLVPAFGRLAMRRYLGVMVDRAQALADRFQASSVDGYASVVPETTAVALDTIGLCGFGVDLGLLSRGEPHPFVDAMTRVLLGVQRDLARPVFVGRIDLAARARQRRDIRIMRTMVDDIIVERRRTGVEGDDLLALMLTTPDPQDGTFMDDQNVRDQVLTFLIAGHETTSGLLGYALHALAHHPEVYARAQAEVDAVLGTDPDAVPDQGSISKLPYLRQVIDETLRLWPTAPVYIRQPKEATTICGRYDVPPGRELLCVMPAIHRDPSIWGPDANNFNPDNFGPDAPKRPATAYRPFGTGPRTCLGRMFALTEAMVVLSMLLHRFDIELEPGYQLRTRQTLTIKPIDLRMRFVPRAH
ncbi:MAG: cytochrome P450 [Myxococcales bacterium]|nr:cytochrome P450 [Myxococcales bacterium]